MDKRKILLGESLDLLLRNWWALSLGLSAGLLFTAVALKVIPQQYEARASVDTFEGDFPTDLVRSSITKERLALLESLRSKVLESDEILPRLQNWIQERDLPLDLDSVPAEVQKAWIKRIKVLTNRRGRYIDISVQNEDPIVAAGLANVVADLFVEKNSEVRTQLAGDVTETLRVLVEQTGEDLEKKERELADMKRRYPYQTDEQRPFNQQMISSLQQDLRTVQDSRAQVELQIEMLEAERMQAEMMGADPFQEGPPVPGMGSSGRLLELKKELEQLRLRYAEEHPDVQAKLREIEEYESSPGSDPEPPGSVADGPPLRDNDLWASQIRSAQLSLERLKAQERDIRAKIAQYQRYLDETPRIQAEMDRLERDVQALQRKYAELKSREEAARAAQRVEETKSWSRFEVAAYAGIPSMPKIPNPFLTLLLCVGSGLFMAIGPILARQILAPRILSLQRVAVLGEPPVLATIPVLSTEETRRKRRWAKVREIASVAMSISAIVGAAYISGWLP